MECSPVTYSARKLNFGENVVSEPEFASEAKFWIGGKILAQNLVRMNTRPLAMKPQYSSCI